MSRAARPKTAHPKTAHPKRTLSLKREPLTALTTDDLAGVHGAAIPTLLGICDWTQESSPVNCVTDFTRCLCK